MDFINLGRKFWVTHRRPVSRVGRDHRAVKRHPLGMVEGL